MAIDEIRAAFRTSYNFFERWYNRLPLKRADYEAMGNEMIDLSKGATGLSLELMLAVFEAIASEPSERCHPMTLTDAEAAIIDKWRTATMAKREAAMQALN